MHAILDFPHLFEQTFDNAPIGMALVSPEGAWIRVNKSLCKLTGYSNAELLDSTFQDITYPDDLHLDMTRVADTLKGKIDGYQIEKRYVKKSRALVWTRLSVSLVRDDNNKPAFFISQIEDIQTQKDLEATLKQEADHFSSIINTMTDPLFVKTENHRSVLVNDALCSFMGRTKQELLGAPGDHFFPAEEVNTIEHGDDMVLNSGKEVMYEEVISDKKGVKHAVIVKKHLYTNADNQRFVVGTFHDITERKAREDELKKKYQELEDMNRMMLGRELKMIELKKQLAELKK